MMLQHKKGLLSTTEMEILISEYFDPRINLAVPNVSWGLGLHECDILILTKSGCAYEIEIKTSKSDLKADAKKYHGHFSKRIKRLYFAIPEYLGVQEMKKFIPNRAGILVARWRKERWDGPEDIGNYIIEQERAAKENGAYKFNDRERYKMARLGALRIWGLKKNITRMLHEKEEMK